MSDTLEDLLRRSSPDVPPVDGERRDVLVAMVAEARRSVARERGRRRTRRSLGGVAVVALIGLGTAAAAGVLPGQDNIWGGPLAGDAAKELKSIEWTSTNPDGRLCVERLDTIGLSESELASIEAVLGDPASLVANDGGAVRQEFLDEGWSDGSAADLAAIDAAYDEVARIDVDAGRGDIADEDLTNDFIDSRTDELFQHVYWRLVLDGIGAGPDAQDEAFNAKILGPLTACEVQR